LIYKLNKVNHGGRYKCGDGIVGAVAAGVVAVAAAAGVAAVAAAAAGADITSQLLNSKLVNY
jgi:hypothetical protein